MLTVAPKGKTKPETRLSTFKFSSTHFMVTGSVALDEEVEKAMDRASPMPANNFQGGVCVKIQAMAGSTTPT